MFRFGSNIFGLKFWNTFKEQSAFLCCFFLLLIFFKSSFALFGKRNTFLKCLTFTVYRLHNAVSVDMGKNQPANNH